MTGIAVRVSSSSAGRIEFRENSPTGFLVASITVPNLNGNYSELAAPIVDKRGGTPATIELYIVFRTDVGVAAPLVGLNWIRFIGSGVSIQQAPFGNGNHALPGIIQAEDFDTGGESVGYHDTTSTNEDGAYRPLEGVDIASTTDGSGGYDILRTYAGEWLEYTVDVGTPGLYNVEFRIAPQDAGAVFHLEADGVDKTGPITIPSSTLPASWISLTRSNLALTQGRQILRLSFDVNAGSGTAGRFNFLRFIITQTNQLPSVAIGAPRDGSIFTYPADITVSASASDTDGQVRRVEFYAGHALIGVATNAPFTVVWEDAPVADYTLTAVTTDNLGGRTISSPVTVKIVSGQSPYNAVPALVPGMVQVEDYDIGGEGLAYHDSDTSNNGAKYRQDAVDIESTADSGGGFNVGWTAAGEWLEYSVSATVDGTYQIETRVASSGVAGNFHLAIDGKDITGPLTPGDTGGWQTWKTLVTAGVPLSSGPHKLRLSLDSAGANGTAGNYNWIRFVATATNTAPATLEFASPLSGVFGSDATAILNANSKTFTIPIPLESRYYRIRSTNSSRITIMRKSGNVLLLNYE